MFFYAYIADAMDTVILTAELCRGCDS